MAEGMSADLEKVIRSEIGLCMADLKAELAERKAKGQEEQDDLTSMTAEKKRKPRIQISESEKHFAGRYVAFLAACRGDVKSAERMAKAQGHDLVAKALGSSEVSTGGAILEETVATEIIEALRARSVVRKAGARSVPMDGGSLTLPYISTGSSAAYVGENSNITKTQPTLGQLALSEKILAALVPLSNKLLRNSAGRAGQFVEEDLLAAMATKEDSTFIRGQGTQYEPRGFAGWVQEYTTNTFAANATVSAANTVADLVKMVRLLMETNVPMTQVAWFIAPRIWAYLLGLLDSNSNHIYRTEMEKYMLYGWPVFVTTSIPTNLGSGTNESEIYLADMSQYVLAEALNMTLTIHDGATYHDGSSLVSGLSQDQSIVKSISGHDFGDRHRGRSVVQLTACKWGA